MISPPWWTVCSKRGVKIDPHSFKMFLLYKLQPQNPTSECWLSPFKASIFDKCHEGMQISTCRRMKLDLSLSFSTKINQWVRDLNGRPEALKVLEQLGAYFKTQGRIRTFQVGFAAQERGASINKWDFSNFQTFCTEKEMVNGMKTPPTE